ncbi:MAG: Eco57I restriction-modification methylase domain-containing protein [Aquihabitans sp.]
MRAPQQLSLMQEPMTLADLGPDPGVDHGEVFTRRWVVDLILDLVGYTPDRDLASLVLVEPSCGTGAFLGPIVDRLIASTALHGHDLRSLAASIRAFDLLDANAELTRKAVRQRLHEAGLPERESDALARQWVLTGDFLLHDHGRSTADFVVGNPPYIRLEAVPPRVMEAYRRVCPTMRGRSDIYVGFIERGLDLLKPQGVLGYICPDRWMRNQYGADLRELIGGCYAVDTVITMHDVDAFENDVSAYPAIVVLRNAAQGPTAVVDAKMGFGEDAAGKLAAWSRTPRSRTLASPTFEASRLRQVFKGRDLWPVGSPAQLALIADLEARFPPLEDRRTGTRVGIGVATGCDDIYITTDATLVESDRLLPLLKAVDTTSGRADWSGNYLVNPWNHDGLVELDRYPRLQDYLDANAGRLHARHIAKQRPSQWYRTIDRVAPDLLARPKLVLPDLKAAAHPVIDEGRFYPHHNLYFVVSNVWDLEVLGGLLLSDVANLFVGAYCVKMRGGTYRFQAQYLRRIRVPDVGALGRNAAKCLATAFQQADRDAATAVAAKLYGLDPQIVGKAVRRRVVN